VKSARLTRERLEGEVQLLHIPTSPTAATRGLGISLSGTNLRKSEGENER
jgi:hypothetical protein